MKQIMQTPDFVSSKKKVHIKANPPLITLSSQVFEVPTPRDSPTFKPPESIEPADKIEVKIETEPNRISSNTEVIPNPESSKASHKDADGFNLEHKYEGTPREHNYELSPQRNKMEMSEHVKKWVRPLPDTLNSENQFEVQGQTMLQIQSINSSERYKAVVPQTKDAGTSSPPSFAVLDKIP